MPAIASCCPAATSAGRACCRNSSRRSPIGAMSMIVAVTGTDSDEVDHLLSVGQFVETLLERRCQQEPGQELNAGLLGSVPFRRPRVAADASTRSVVIEIIPTPHRRAAGPRHPAIPQPLEMRRSPTRRCISTKRLVDKPVDDSDRPPCRRGVDQLQPGAESASQGSSNRSPRPRGFDNLTTKSMRVLIRGGLAEGHGRVTGTTYRSGQQCTANGQQTIAA